jgi:hypothetical protein
VLAPSIMTIRLLILSFIIFSACTKSDSPTPAPGAGYPKLSVTSTAIDNTIRTKVYYNVSYEPQIRLNFSAPVDPTTVNGALTVKDAAGGSVNITTSLMNGDSSVLIKPSTLKALSKYNVGLQTTLRSRAGAILDSATNLTLITAIDSTDKFPLISDGELLTRIQQQTFKYFWDYAHPVSGMIRDRNKNPDLVTTGGTGMGIMTIVTAIHRNFISRGDGIARVAKIVDFLQSKATTYHGAYAHFINGATGATIPFSEKDNGADLVETSLLMQGLLTARQYFSGSDATEVKLRTDINQMFSKVEWSWFRQNNQNVLYWHWSPLYNWDINLSIRGWNEALITYVLAAAPGNYSIPKQVYDEGWARNGGIRNGKQYFGITLPLGPEFGGPLFFSHYSFLGINPKTLKDTYANYWEQVVAHTAINQKYCESNPTGHNGYSHFIWGLTASDDNYTGYSAHSPANDLGIISPTAAISSLPYTTPQSMDALRFFYYKLGDKLWKEYGFIDAFNLNDLWFADSFLAIDQAPQIIMIENYRSGLLWDLFMSCPEVQGGLTKLGFRY